MITILKYRDNFQFGSYRLHKNVYDGRSYQDVGEILTPNSTMNTVTFLLLNSFTIQYRF
ncbi:MAG: hypothetical protein ACK5HU_02110 [Flavobacteriales bacterium]